MKFLRPLALTLLAVAPALHAAPTLTWLGSFGSKGTGNGRFDFPYAVAVDAPTSTVYVTDYNNDRVESFDTTGKFLGKWGSSGTGDGEFDRAESPSARAAATFT
jgi:DNA-binding beta-propeller fold protein YncE